MLIHQFARFGRVIVEVQNKFAGARLQYGGACATAAAGQLDQVLTSRVAVREPAPKHTADVCFISTDEISFRPQRAYDKGELITFSFGGPTRDAVIDYVGLEDGLFIASAHWAPDK
jgi:hypothetical protein